MLIERLDFAVVFGVANSGMSPDTVKGARVKPVPTLALVTLGSAFRPSIYDRSNNGEWVFLGGCA